MGALWKGLGPGASVCRRARSLPPVHVCRRHWPPSPVQPSSIPAAPPGAGLHRQVVYGGLRIGLYEPIKRL